MADERLFKEEIIPSVDGANPYQEKKYAGPAQAINPRAVLQKIVYLYTSEPHQTKLGSKNIQTSGFMEIRRPFFIDGEWLSLPFLHFGLKDVSTGKDIRVYSQAEYDADPVRSYRTTKVLELLPQLADTALPLHSTLPAKDLIKAFKASDQAIEDYCCAITAATTVFYSWELENKSKRREITRRKERIASIIGVDHLNAILISLPPHLEEIIFTMQANEAPVDTRTLKEEFRIGRILPSEFYLDLVVDDNKRTADLIQGAIDIGWLPKTTD